MNDDFLNAILADPIAAIAAFYATCLTANDRVKAYVNDDLHLTDEQASEQQVGFADRTLGKQIPHRRIKRGREVRDALVEANLYKANGRETMRGRVTVPIQDNDGNIIGMRGYKIDAHASGEDVITVGQSEVDTSRAAQAPVNASEELTTKQTKDTKTDDSDDLIIEDNQIIFLRDDRRYRIRERNKGDGGFKKAFRSPGLLWARPPGFAVMRLCIKLLSWTKITIFQRRTITSFSSHCRICGQRGV